MTKLSKADHLKDELFDVFNKLKKKQIDKDSAREMIKAANSICTVVKTELAVAKYNTPARGRKKKITL